MAAVLSLLINKRGQKWGLSPLQV